LPHPHDLADRGHASGAPRIRSRYRWRLRSSWSRSGQCPASTSSPEDATPQSDPLSTAFCPPHNGARRNEQQFVEVVLVRSSGPSPARRELIQLCLRPRLGHTPPENPSRSSRALSSRQYPSVIQVRFPWPKRSGSGYRRRLSSRQDGGRHTRTISLNPLYDRLTFQCRGVPQRATSRGVRLFFASHWVNS
jgi:hypothetical protein